LYLKPLLATGGNLYMPGKSIQTIDRETLSIRLKMRTLMESQDLSINQALNQALPKDSNRSKKLQLWIDKGLWPIPQGSTTISTTSSTTNTITSNPALVPPKAIQPRSAAVGTINSTTHIPLQDDYPEPIKFLGPKITTSVKISCEIQKRAIHKARSTDALYSRANMSGLVEYLLWQYAGSDDALIKR
jgi:hypothetical protein